MFLLPLFKTALAAWTQQLIKEEEPPPKRQRGDQHSKWLGWKVMKMGKWNDYSIINVGGGGRSPQSSLHQPHETTLHTQSVRHLQVHQADIAERWQIFFRGFPNFKHFLLSFQDLSQCTIEFPTGLCMSDGTRTLRIRRCDARNLCNEVSCSYMPE